MKTMSRTIEKRDGKCKISRETTWERCLGSVWLGVSRKWNARRVNQQQMRTGGKHQTVGRTAAGAGLATQDRLRPGKSGEGGGWINGQSETR